MDKIAMAIDAISRTSSRDEKMTLLRNAADIPGFKEVLKFIYNPYCKTGISDAKFNKALSDFSSTNVYHQTPISVYEAIEYFTKHQTGNLDDMAFASQFYADACGHYHDASVADLARAIVTQNLKIGVTATSLNKVYGNDFIPKIGCMLGTPYDTIGGEKIHWPCIVTEKLDGVRRILVKQDGVCRMFSRSGHEDTGLVEILEEAKYLPDNYVYDGELLAKGTFKDSIALRQATNSIANCKGERTGLTFNVFDMIPLGEFLVGKSDDSAYERKTRLAATLMDMSLEVLQPEQWWYMQQAFGIHKELQHITAVPILGVVNSLVEAEPIVEEIWSLGGEGIMLNTTIGLYEVKRSKHLIKVKHVEEFTLQVVDVIEGGGKYEDMLGCIVVKYKGSFVGVGSGFTDAQRQEIWEHPEQYIGRQAEIESFGESTNAQGYVSLNCPIFKRFVGDYE